MPLVPVSFLLIVRKKQSLCLGPVSPLHILSRENSIAGIKVGLHSSVVLRRQFVGNTPHEILFTVDTLGVV